MATFNIYTYCVWLKYSAAAAVSRTSSCFKDEENLEAILENSIDISLDVDKRISYTFGYDEPKEIYLIRFTGVGAPPNFRYSLKEFIEYLGSLPQGYLNVKTKRNLRGLTPVVTENIIDWSQTITDLEAKGVVKTAKSDSFLANDERKFWFIGSGDATDVDCLGTVLHEDLNEMVLNRWRELFSEIKRDDI